MSAIKKLLEDQYYLDSMQNDYLDDEYWYYQSLDWPALRTEREEDVESVRTERNRLWKTT